MSSKITAAMLTLALTLVSCYGQTQGDSNEPMIKKLEREHEAALLKGDTKTLDRILADDYLEIDARGDVKKKSDVLRVARSMSGVQRGVSIGPDRTVDEFAIRIHGDSALVVGRTTIRYQFMENQTVGTPPSQSQNPVVIDQERFIRIYSKISGRWQLVAWQTTAIAKR
jgi:hypothetical protein